MPPYTHLEFHRSGIGLVPEGAGQHTAIYVAHVPGSTPGSSQALRSCTCAASKKKTCDHLKDLSRAVAEVQKSFARQSWEQTFAASVWHRLARLLFEGNPQPAAKVRVLRIDRDGEGLVRVTSAAGDELAQILDTPDAQLRFLERTGKVALGAGIFDRADLLERLALFQSTPQEREFYKRGMKTQRQTWEESFWHRLAYHCVRELEPGESGSFHPAIDEASGAFTLTFRRGAEPVVKVTVPRDRVRAALLLLAEVWPEQEDLILRPIPLRSIFHVSEQTELDLVEVRPVIRQIQETGEERFLELAEVEKFRYGNLIWLKDLRVLAELEREGRERKFRAPARMTLRRHQVPGFLEEHAGAIGEGAMVLDAPLRDRKVFKIYDRIEIAAIDLDEALERSWWWLAIEYGFGSERISLAEILAARKAGLPYLEVPGGWIDLHAPAFRDLEELLEHGIRGEHVRLSASELLLPSKCQPNPGGAWELAAPTDPPPETTALGPLWIATTDAASVTELLDRHALAADTVVIHLRGALPAAPGPIAEALVVHDGLVLEDVIYRLSGNGGGTAGQTQLDLLVDGATLYPSAAQDDQRPAWPFDTAVLFVQGRIHELTELHLGQLLQLVSMEHPTGGTPARAEAYLLCRRP